MKASTDMAILSFQSQFLTQFVAGELVMLLGSGRLPEETLSSWDEVCLVILVFGRGESVEVVVVLGSSFGLLVEAVMASKKRHSLDYYSFDWTYRAQI